MLEMYTNVNLYLLGWGFLKQIFFYNYYKVKHASNPHSFTSFLQPTPVLPPHSPPIMMDLASKNISNIRPQKIFDTQHVENIYKAGLEIMFDIQTLTVD